MRLALELGSNRVQPSRKALPDRRNYLTGFRRPPRNEPVASRKWAAARATMPQDRSRRRLAANGPGPCGNRVWRDRRMAETAVLQRDHEDEVPFGRRSHG